MKRKKTDLIWLVVSIALFLCMSVSFLLMPIETSATLSGLSVTAFIAGIAFWLFLLLGCVSQAILTYRRNKWYVINRVRYGKIKQGKLGIISFFQNKYAMIADITLAVSFLTLVCLQLFGYNTGYICYVLVCTCSFSFCMHCILNGKIFYHITHQDELMEAVEALRKEATNRSEEEKK